MELYLVNKDGEQLDLLNNDDYFILSGCDALHGVDTEIAEVDSPYLDGSQIENVRALPRGISMTFTLIPNIRESIDFFTNVVKSKQYVTLIEKENGREISIKGIATIPPYTRMLSLCKIQLDIYCGQPYWEDIASIISDIALVVPLLNFPMGVGQYFTQEGRAFSVVDTSLEKTFSNDGDVSVGMKIYITALNSVTNPKISCTSGDQYGWYMQLNLTLNANDEVEINTTRGNKYIKINGLETYNGNPILSYLEFSGTDWLQLETGENTFEISASSGVANVYFTISYNRRYE